MTTASAMNSNGLMSHRYNTMMTKPTASGPNSRLIAPVSILLILRNRIPSGIKVMTVVPQSRR